MRLGKHTSILLLGLAISLASGCAGYRGRFVPVGEALPLPPVPDVARPSPLIQQPSRSAPQPIAAVVPPTSEEIDVTSRTVVQVGIASWYGSNEQGRRTASGERFSVAGYTAAHRTLPFGTLVKVRNLANQREVIVRITDRGPFIKGRIIDLSPAAAKAIGISRTGTARVELEVLPIR